MGSTTSSSISTSSRSMGTFITDAITTNLFFQGDQAQHCDLGQGVQGTACDPWIRRVHQGHHRRLWEVSTMYRLRPLSKAASSITSDCIPNMISDCQRWIIEPVWFDICPMPLSQLSLWSGISQSRRSWILKLPGVEATARELRRTTSPNWLVEIPTSGGLVSAQPMDRGRLGLVHMWGVYFFSILPDSPLATTRTTSPSSPPASPSPTPWPSTTWELRWASEGLPITCTCMTWH